MGRLPIHADIVGGTQATSAGMRRGGIARHLASAEPNWPPLVSHWQCNPLFPIYKHPLVVILTDAGGADRGGGGVRPVSPPVMRLLRALAPHGRQRLCARRGRLQRRQPVRAGHHEAAASL